MTKVPFTGAVTVVKAPPLSLSLPVVVSLSLLLPLPLQSAAKQKVASCLCCHRRGARRMLMLSAAGAEVQNSSGIWKVWECGGGGGVERSREERRGRLSPSFTWWASLQHPSTSSWISGVKKSRGLLHRSSWYFSARTGQQEEVSGVTFFILGERRDQMLGCWSECWSPYILNVGKSVALFPSTARKQAGVTDRTGIFSLCKNLVACYGLTDFERHLFVDFFHTFYAQFPMHCYLTGSGSRCRKHVSGESEWGTLSSHSAY